MTSNILILISVEHKENRRLLQEYLAQYYNVKLLDEIDTLNSQFDLAIFDGVTLNQLWKEIRVRKEIEKSVFLPFLLVTTRQDIRMVTRQLWQCIDELIFAPIEKIELLARVELLLRARSLALELAGKNIELQQETVAHNEIADALRESEERTNLLQKLTSELATVLTPQDISNTILDRVVTAVGGHLGLMGLIKSNQVEIEILGMKGFTEEALNHYRQIALKEALPLTTAIDTGQPIWIEMHEEYLAGYPQLRSFLSETNTQSAAAIPLKIKEETIGGIKIFFPKEKHFTNEDKAFLEAVTQQFAQALERVRLYEEEREKAVMEERQRLARDLHDDISQSLASINMMGQTLPRIWEKDPARGREILQDLVTMTQAATSGMRALLFELRPANIVRSSLSNLFKQLVTSIQGRRKIHISCIVDFDQALPEDVHVTFYRIVQESLNNMVKHSEATEGSILLTEENHQIVLRIRDNGRGFDKQTLSAGFGLEGMRERAALIGASCEVFSTDGHGTEIVISKTMPL